MHRKEGALQDLNALLVTKRNEPFAWGKWDCCIFAADCVLAMTGEDKLTAFRGAYDSKYTAAKALRELGNGTLDKTLQGHLGRTIAPHMAWRGDLTIYKNNVGICVGTHAYFVSENGFMSIPMRDIEKVYPIR